MISPTVRVPPAQSRTPFAVRTTRPESASSAVARSTPPAIVVGPVNVFAPERTSVPGPVFVRPPSGAPLRSASVVSAWPIS